MIQYVCVSDLHFGAATSLMTYLDKEKLKINPQKPSATLIDWVKCLEKIISETNPKGSPKPKLILNGDIMELALSNTNETAMAFDQFIMLIFPEDKTEEEWIFQKDMCFLPGNHDHHLWEKAREIQYIRYMHSRDINEKLEKPWHTTNVYKYNPVPCDFLNGVIQRHKHLKEVNVETMYPNYLVTNEDKTKGVIFSHGHYIESIYSLISQLKVMIFPNSSMPKDIWELEAENFAWIDFFWSTMGRSGDAGKDIEVIYNKMQDEKALKELTNNLATSIAEKLQKDDYEASIMEMIKHELEETVIEHALKWILGKTGAKIAKSERGFSDKALEDKTEKGLKDFVEIYLKKQIESELKTIPSDLTIIFGHTHKPFEKIMQFEGYAKNTKVYNDGGWVVDTIQQQKYHGGAIILIDENLDCASIRMYNEGNYKISVAEAKKKKQDVPSEFVRTLDEKIDSKKEPFSSFGKTINKEVQLRYDYLKNMVKGK